ncbi:MAG: valine--tRNA ligase [Nitrospinae bacterium]|nr:valine--tRNA ligase [Nitrospinota bacterium]
MNPGQDTLSKAYDPSQVEQKWYQFWQEQGLFHADENSERPPFSIVIPPPNVTGLLHMGHALNNTLQDILCRWKRMEGYNVLWLPGTDHAGIATQNVVEQQLLKEGTDRHQLGRERFIQRVWRWREESGRTIIHQLKRLGSSCDWERERFTLDEGLSAAVREVFVRLYEEGMIYRGDYIINWCPRCQTALSDLEVEHEEMKGNLYYVRYFWVDGPDHLTVATTRPETILGDTAVAVNPKDPRYTGIVGRQVYLPLVKRPLPVVADEYVSIEFGTGALKITPAHDPYDFQVGVRHQLPSLKVIDEKGQMSEATGQYAGMDRFECRRLLLEELRKEGHLEKVEPHRHAVGHCQRCRTIVEPLLSKQWFVRMEELARPAIEAVQEGRARIIPKGWEKTYFEWMTNIRDWCISRQIWWGHQIPAWHCQDCSGITADRATPAHCKHCGSSKIIQETDVLDTWFSSALWPFSTLGWPQRTRELELFYPTSVLVTAFDILFFWVARMMMMGLKFRGDVPFRDVYIHALVKDIEGKKMSKSRGNVIDPLIMIDRYGADAFRFTLAAFAVQGRDILLSEERIQGYRHFANKLWNAARFVLMNLEGYSHPATPEGEMGDLDQGQLTIVDRWILSRLTGAIRQVKSAMEEYRFNEVANALYQFIWHEYCDWYLELIKPRLRSAGPDRLSAQRVMVWVLDMCLRMLHPIMPFITEELWQQLPVEGETIMRAPFPQVREVWFAPQTEEEMGLTMEVIGEIRNIRSELNIAPSKKVEVILSSPDEGERAMLQAHAEDISLLASLASLTVVSQHEKILGALTSMVSKTEVIVLPGEGIDMEGERKRLRKELAKIEEDLLLLEEKLSREDFRAKAPPEIVEKNLERREALREKESRLRRGLARIEGEA